MFECEVRTGAHDVRLYELVSDLRSVQLSQTEPVQIPAAVIDLNSKFVHSCA